MMGIESDGGRRKGVRVGGKGDPREAPARPRKVSEHLGDLTPGSPAAHSSLQQTPPYSVGARYDGVVS